jgi:hypothetical protein
MDGDRPHEGAEVELAHVFMTFHRNGSQSRLVHRRQCTAERMPDQRVSP